MDIKDLINKLNTIEETYALDEAGRRTAKKVAQNVFNRMATQAGATPPPSIARVGGKTWEPVPGVPGKYYNTANKSEQVTADELKKLQSAGAAANATPAVAPAAGAAATAASSLKQKGAFLANYIKSNPKLAAAVAAAAAIYAGGKALEPSKTEPSPAPAPGPAPAPNNTGGAEQAGLPDQSADLKKQIDALITELSASKDQQVQKELARIKTKYAGSAEQGGLPANTGPANAFDIKRNNP
jgi:hypothetical protein